jgi:hypothetical protein
MRDQNVLHKKYAVMILKQAKKILQALPTLVEVNYPE